MVYILNIHTATETAIVNLTNEEGVVSTLTNHETKEHASFLHVAIHKILAQQKINVKELSSIGVSSGPGSYTGIRVGLSAAKGLCYALKIPMITYNSLELLARSAIEQSPDQKALYCSMIDARRMEIYTAIYKSNMDKILAPSAVIIDENSFADLLTGNKIYFIGSGSEKFKHVVKNEKASFINGDINSKSIADISWRKFEENNFQNIFNADPLYIKDFHTILKK